MMMSGEAAESNNAMVVKQVPSLHDNNYKYSKAGEALPPQKFNVGDVVEALADYDIFYGWELALKKGEQLTYEGDYDSNWGWGSRIDEK
jgi:hypothetical protein